MNSDNHKNHLGEYKDDFSFSLPTQAWSATWKISKEDFWAFLP